MIIIIKVLICICKSFQTFSDKQKIVKVKVDGSKLGRPDGYGRHYVKLRAQCTAMHFYKETYILVSQRTGTVFLQTDKPLYSPKQNGVYFVTIVYSLL